LFFCTISSTSSLRVTFAFYGYGIPPKGLYLIYCLVDWYLFIFLGSFWVLAATTIVAPFFCQFNGNGFADASAGACNDGNFSG